ncbi:(Fe-S)-binding protein [Pelobacter seleniigenes]|uniref:(Fe-S)-binding protein n=1 Tax=Pelobacter seleniigenes TaxID=407188 RepID=UPI000A019531|nr:(Fe-S)-binding protein [Pelobacter seleniigenes]
MTAVTDRSRSVLERFRTDCTGCGLCSRSCEILMQLAVPPAELAEQLVAGARLAESMESAVQHCALCGLCSQSCPLDLNPGDLFQAAREVLMEQERIDPLAYRPMLVDQQAHFFSLYRQSWEIDFSDLEKLTGPTLFWPGCSLASFAPELTRAAHRWLQQQGFEVGFSADCCGLPLHNIGLGQRGEQYLARLAKQFAAKGVKQLITACPNCYYHFQNSLTDIKVSSLFTLMVEADLRLAGQSGVTVHDSCPDRASGQIGQALRTLLQGAEIVEMTHHGSETLCCGAGGIVSMVNPELSQARAERRAAEIAQTGTETCVSACMACVKRLQGTANLSAVQAQQCSEPARVVHILELIFGIEIDHDRLQQQLELMWQGELGQRNLALLNGAGQEE